MLTTVYIVNSEPVDLNKVVLPNYIEGREAGLGYGYKAVALATHGSLIQHGIDALLSVYPSARVTSLRSQAATWCHELGTWGGARPGACLLLTSDAADELPFVDTGGRGNIKQQNQDK